MRSALIAAPPVATIMAESGTNWARASGSLVLILLLLGLIGSQLLASEEQPQLLSRRSLRESVRRYLLLNDIYVVNSTYNVNTTNVTVVGTVVGPNASTTGYWSTRGRQILDFYGKEVRLLGHCSLSCPRSSHSLMGSLCWIY